MYRHPENLMAKKNVENFIYWTPRMLSILFILFLMLFSLDVFDGQHGFWETVAGLLIHNIPSLLLAGILVISWKRELVGGVAFTLAGLMYITLFLGETSVDSWYVKLSWALTIAAPALLIGVLFLVGWYKKRTEGRKRKALKS
jgi:hypothetical protein